MPSSLSPCLPASACLTRQPPPARTHHTDTLTHSQPILTLTLSLTGQAIRASSSDHRKQPYPPPSGPPVFWRAQLQLPATRDKQARKERALTLCSTAAKAWLSLLAGSSLRRALPSRLSVAKKEAHVTLTLHLMQPIALPSSSHTLRYPHYSSFFYAKTATRPRAHTHDTTTTRQPGCSAAPSTTRCNGPSINTTSQNPFPVAPARDKIASSCLPRCGIPRCSLHGAAPRYTRHHTSLSVTHGSVALSAF